MIRVNVRANTTQLNLKLNRQIAALKALPQQGLTEFRRLTPIDRGNARRRTDLKGHEIVGDYPYAQRLENNWSSQTRGQGIIKPFTKWWVARLKQIARIK